MIAPGVVARMPSGRARALWACGLSIFMGCAPAPKGEQRSGAVGSGPGTAEVSDGSAAPAEEAAPTPPGPIFDVSGVRPLLSEPAFAVAAEKAARGKHADAAGAVMTLVDDAASTLKGDERAAALFLAGSLYERAGATAQARAALARAAEPGSATRAPAELRLLELAARAGDHAAAVKLWGEMRDEVVPRERVDDAAVESLIRAGDLERARALYGPIVTGARRGPGWSRSALRLAKALLAKPGAERARDALGLCEAIASSAPRGSGADAAEKLKRDAIGRLPAAEQKALERPAAHVLAARGDALATSGQSKRALAVLDRLVKRTDLSPDVACQVAHARGRALGALKRSSESLDELGRAAEACAGRAELADVLYAAGRAAARASAYERARSYFGRLEAAAPTHRLADDARLEGARAAIEAGDAAAARRMLDAMPADYPDGDVTGDGLFLRALEAMERGAFAEAKRPLEVGAARPMERSYQRAGRFTYYLARVHLAARDQAAAKAQLQATVRRAPLSYYAALAVSRLEAIEPGAGRAALDDSLAGAPSVAPPELPADRGEEEGVRAAIAVARAGDARALDDVLSGLGVSGRTAPPEALLFAARMYAVAGDPRRAHAVLRTAAEIEPRKDRVELWSLRDQAPRGAWRAVWELAYPRPFAAEVAHAAAESRLPEALLYAIMREESAFAPEAVSVSDARGLFQLMPGTGASMARGLGLKLKPDSLFDPGISARLGARYLGILRGRFAAAPLLCVPGYNAGPGAPEAWLVDRPSWDLDLWVERIPYAETRGYTKRVLSSLFTYEVLHGGGEPRETLSLPVRL